MSGGTCEPGPRRDVVVRRATQDDVDGMEPLLHDLYEADIGPDFSTILAEFIEGEAHLVLVAALAGRIVGVLIGSYRLDIDYECRAGLVDAIVVHKGHRGKGIGTRLMQDFERWARDRRCTALQVQQGRGWFFERMGFKERTVVFYQKDVIAGR